MFNNEVDILSVIGIHSKGKLRVVKVGFRLVINYFDN